MRLCDILIGDLEARVEATSLTPTGAADPLDFVDGETLAQWAEVEADLDDLGRRDCELAGWVDAGDVVVDDVRAQDAA